MIGASGPVSAAVGVALIVVGLLVGLAVRASVAPSPAEPAPAPGTVPTLSGVGTGSAGISLEDGAALAALAYLTFQLVWWTVGGVRRAVAVERRYAQEVRDHQRQDRRCPYCGGWFNTTALQDAHEEDCDQHPAAVGRWSV